MVGIGFGEGMDELMRGMRDFTEPERDRLDESERQIGRIATRGIIIGVENADTGLVLIRLTTRAEVSAQITRPRYPMPRAGDEVEVTITADQKASANPIGPELFSPFTATVVSRTGSGDPYAPHGGLVRQSNPLIGSNGIVFAQAGLGVQMLPPRRPDPDNDPSASDLPPTQVLCAIAWQGLVAETSLVDHEIYAIMEIPGPGTIENPRFIPPGGAEDALLTKQSAGDYDAAWVVPP